MDPLFPAPSTSCGGQYRGQCDAPRLRLWTCCDGRKHYVNAQSNRRRDRIADPGPGIASARAPAGTVECFMFYRLIRKTFKDPSPRLVPFLHCPWEANSAAPSQSRAPRQDERCQTDLPCRRRSPAGRRGLIAPPSDTAAFQNFPVPARKTPARVGWLNQTLTPGAGKPGIRVLAQDNMKHPDAGFGRG